jgi:large subunit ribosomal protein L9
MAVEVLLRKTVESLGRVGDVVKVRNGYARNFLLPHGIAVLPSAENLRLVEKDKVAEAAVEAEKAKARAELAGRLQGVSVTVEAKANPDGHLFGSVGAAQVAAALVAKGLPIDEKQVRLEPVKQLGEYEVKVHLAPDVEPTVKLWVVEELANVPEGPGAPAKGAAKPASEAKDASKDAKKPAAASAKGASPAPAKAAAAPARGKSSSK